MYKTLCPGPSEFLIRPWLFLSLTQSPLGVNAEFFPNHSLSFVFLARAPTVFQHVFYLLVETFVLEKR